MADTITGKGQPYIRRRRGEVRAGWLAARARNTLRRPMRIGAIAAAAFIATLIALLLAPKRTDRGAPPPVAAPWRDTTRALAAQARTRARLAAADSALDVTRALALQANAEPSPLLLAPEVVARRDSLQRLADELTALLTRADNAPLPASYRALGDSPTLRDDPRVRQLLDSLADIERERDEFGAVGAVDPVFVSLTARASAIGRAVQALADARRAGLRRQLAALAPDSSRHVAHRPVVDTLAPLAERAAAAAAFDEATRTLAEARTANAALDARLRRERERANLAAPPEAILAAALVLGLALGFGLALAAEMRRPRVADRAETEFVSGARVLAVLAPRRTPPERRRRRADRALPPLLDPTADAYRLLASHLTVIGPTGALATLTGDVPAVTAAVAANIAAAAANDLRSTLLVDADFAVRPVESLLRVDGAPGLTAVLEGTRDWTETLRSVAVGRDRTLDVLPCGPRRHPLTADERAELGAPLRHAARRYDLTLAVLPVAQARALRPASDVLLCVQVGHTSLRALKRWVAELRDDGVRIIGVVLWHADAPALPALLERAG